MKHIPDESLLLCKMYNYNVQVLLKYACIAKLKEIPIICVNIIRHALSNVFDEMLHALIVVGNHYSFAR